MDDGPSMMPEQKIRIHEDRNVGQTRRETLRSVTYDGSVWDDLCLF